MSAGGRVRSAEVRAKMSVDRRGRKYTKEQKLAFGARQRDKKGRFVKNEKES